jgi:hypothetical protein
VINIYNGLTFLGETEVSGRHWIPGVFKKSIKTLFRFRSRAYGLIALIPRDWWEIDSDYLTHLDRYFLVEVRGYDRCGELVHIHTWDGGYPEKAKELIYIVVVKNQLGQMIGDVETAIWLLKKGVLPELADGDSNICSIGFCEKEQKWYGWSHRAIYGFGIGDVVKDDDCASTSGLCDEYLAEHPEENKALPIGFISKTLDDCKKMAIAFADSVG